MAPCSSSCPAHIHNLGPSSTFVSGDSLFFGRGINAGLPRLASLRERKSGRRSAGPGPVLVVSEKVVGIDLGTTNSAVAATEGGKPTIVTNAEGQRTTPSVVACPKSGDQLVGQIAKRQAVVNPENTFSVKRFIGRKMPEVDEESKQVSYRVVRDGKGNVKLECPPSGSSLLPMRFLLRFCKSWWMMPQSF